MQAAHAQVILDPLPRIIEMTSMSKSTILRRVRDGGFPPPVRISARRIAWRRDDILAWLENQKAE